MNEIEELKEKLIGMDKAFFNNIKKCENMKENLLYLSCFEFVLIILLLLVALL